MLRVNYSITRCDGPLWFSCKGHADYKDPQTGNNDVCVAVSTICMMLAKYLDDEFGIQPIIFEDGHVVFDIKESNMRINEVFRASVGAFKHMSQMYPQALIVC